MTRKLYALFILIGAIGALVLAYMYFFVYYTSTLIIDSNVTDYKVELFSKSTAQKRSTDCKQERCTLTDVSPFQYNISISKPEYETQVIPMKVRARKKEELYIKLEKKVRLESLQLEKIAETPKEKIQRLREQNRYYAVFQADTDDKLIFEELGDTLKMSIINSKEKNEITSFAKVPKKEIEIQNIIGTEDILLSLAETNYIYLKNSGKIQKLPYTFKILYMKKDQNKGEYIVIFEKGSFIYNAQSKNSGYNYAFKDYVSLDDTTVIGIVFADETQKKKNFNLDASGNLIIRYDLKTKTRKVIYSSSEKFKKIYFEGEKLMVETKKGVFELKNYK